MAENLAQLEFDLSIGSMLLTIFSPVFLLCAILIRVLDPSKRFTLMSLAAAAFIFAMWVFAIGFGGWHFTRGVRLSYILIPIVSVLLIAESWNRRTKLLPPNKQPTPHELEQGK